MSQAVQISQVWHENPILAWQRGVMLPGLVVPFHLSSEAFLFVFLPFRRPLSMTLSVWVRWRHNPLHAVVEQHLVR